MCQVVGDGRLLPAAVHRELERSDWGREHQASTGETAVWALGGAHQGPIPRRILKLRSS